MHYSYSGVICSQEKLMEKLSLNDFINRSFRYGDGFFESILLVDNRLPLWTLHSQRIVQSAQFVFEIANNEVFTDHLKSQILELAMLNGLTTARVRITFWRSGGGTYRSIENSMEYFIEVTALDFTPFENLKTIDFSVCLNIKKPRIPLSNFKTNSSLYFVLAQREAKQLGVEEVVLLNTENRICEGSYQNIFLIKDEIIYTPPLDEGCIDGAFRKYMIRFLEQNQVDFKIEPIEIGRLDDADEIFFTTALRGMTAGNLNQPNPISQKLFELLKLEILVG